jgi:amino acid adenylation domain-containing protein/non-ribosomal peptide synthase protein (TIGR01720 family)
MTNPTADLTSLSPAQRALLEERLRQRRSDRVSRGIARRADQSAAPLSFGQQRLWFIDELEGTGAYNIAGAFRMRGLLDADILARSFDEIVRRHEVLRARITAAAGQPSQTIAAPEPFALAVVDLSALAEPTRLIEARRLAVEEGGRPFDLGSGPLLRALLVRLGSDDHVLIVALHHIAADGWSTGILLRELTTLYSAFRSGQTSPLPELPVQYADYAAWQREALSGDARVRQVSWWRDVLADAPVLELPTDRVRPAAQSTRGARESRVLPAEVWASVHEVSRRLAVTPFAVLLAAFDVLLARYAGTDDVVVGSPVAGRTRTEVEGLIGLFVNTLVLRTAVGSELTFAELLQRVQRTVLDALAHQELPFEMLVDELHPDRTLSHSPLVPVLFAFQNVPTAAVELPGLALSPFDFERATARFDLCLFAVDSGRECTLTAEYSTDLFEASTIAHLLRAFECLVRAAALDPHRRVGSLPLADAAARAELIDGWNRTETAVPRDRTVDELFEAQVARTPDAVALIAGADRLTYRELNERANRLARHLQDASDMAGSLAGICLERSTDMIVATIAALKCGSAYVPLDPAYPDSRLAQMLADCGARVVITTADIAPRLDGSGVSLVCVDRERAAIAARPAANVKRRGVPGGRAYVMYTSGSTGVPKGVAITHRGITRLLFGIDYVHLGADETIVQLAPFSFDAATFEIWGALLHGGRLVLYPDRVATPRELGPFLREHGVSTMWLTGSLYNVVVDEDPAALAGLRQLLIGGDALSVPHVRRGLAALPGTRIVNGYGPTESTTFACCEPIERALPAEARSVPIGRPIGNTRVYLLDEALAPVPVGAPGELYIGGDGLALGYLNAPALTAEKFVPNPFASGGRLYRTGDRARYRADGRIEFLGRLDQQVKIRGYRIECGEIEAALVELDTVREAFVVPVHEDGARKRLVAYIVSAAAEPSVHELRRQLLDRLPDYMVPSAFVFLPALPLNRNGKVDRSALPDPSLARAAVRDGRVTPRNEREATLARIWSDVLRLDSVGVHDNFFELGGDSILSIQIVARAADAGLTLRTKDVFRRQTIAELAEVAAVDAVAAAEQGLVTGPAVLTPIQRWFFSLDAPRPQHFNQAVVLEVEPHLDEAALGRAIAAIVEHHDALRLRFTKEANGEWKAVIAGDVAGDLLDVVEIGSDVDPVAAVEQIGTRLNQRVTFEGGLARFALVRLPQGTGARLICAVHHLAIDGVSWRILLEDLQAAYRQITSSRPVQLPAKTTSWRTWSEKLDGVALPEGEAAIWSSVGGGTPLPLDAAPQALASTIGASERVSVALTAAETAALLHDVPGAFHTQINDALLAALVMAVRGWISGPLVIDLEGHGRESLFDDVDLSRTVGWFTSIYPVRLDVPPDAGPLDTLKRAKETLRAIPGHGIGWGLLRFGSANADVRRGISAWPSASIGFNYLGQFDQTFGADGWRFADASPGRVWDDRTPRARLLDVSAAVVRGELRIDWTFNRQAHRRETIIHLADRFADALRTLTRACTTPGVGGWTPSDFPFVRIDQHSLDRLAERHAGLVDLYPLSPLQEGLLFHAVEGSAAGAYVEQLSCTIDAPFDPAHFERAWAHAIERHAVLRTAFEWEELDRPVQAVIDQVSAVWTVEDWREVPAETRDRELAAWLAADAARGFVLHEAPLTRFALLRTGDASWRFVWSFHHILLDGWSLPIVLKDVVTAYAALVAERPVQLAAREPYRSYIEWLESQDRRSSEAFWRKTLDGFAAPTPLPVERAASAGEVRRLLSEQDTQALHAAARRHQVTVNTLVQAAWALLLARASGDADVVFGTTMSGRPAGLRGVESMVGLFINTLPLRIRVSGDEPLDRWIQEVQARHLAIRDHEHIGLHDVQRWSDVPSGSPLVETLVVFENYPLDSETRPGPTSSLRTRDFHVGERTNFPLTVVASPSARLSLKLLFDGVDGTAAARLLTALHAALVDIASGRPSCVRDVQLLAAADRDQVLARGAGTWAAPMPAESTIGALFEAQAAAAPDREAVRCGADAFSYRELARRSNQWAHLLRQHGAGPDVVVGVCLDGGVELIEVLLGIIKAGAAYMALDPAYPAARLAWMLGEARTPIIVTDATLRSRLPIESGVRVIEIDQAVRELARQPVTNPGVSISPEHLAYVSYTSGSTGQPKGVAVPHRGVVRLLFGVDYAAFGPEQTWLQLAPVGFDASTLEIWGALLHGGRLVVATDRMPTPGALGVLIASERVTAMWLTASLYNAVIDAEPDALAGLTQLLIGGEALSVPHVRRGLAALPSTRIINGYGPTEGTTFTCCYPIPASFAGERSVPIGRPIGRTRVFVLDPTGAPAPVGVPGELHIGGDGLARGYMGQPARTAERFVPDGVSGLTGALLYRTGDVVRWTEDGAIEFVGRRDTQVKIRGFRVETGEIESVLAANRAVQTAAVVAREDAPGIKRLVAYVVPSSGAADEVELRAYLQARLPDYMLPATFVYLSDLPRTPNGKLNRDALPAPVVERHEAQQAPRTAVEQLLAEIWSEVLGVPSVGVDENFFELGGDSILSIRICARAQRAGWSVTPKQLFERQTIAGLASVAIRRTPVSAGDETVSGPVPLLPVQQWFFEQEPADLHHFTQSIMLVVRRVPPAVVERAVIALLAHHDALRSRFARGPAGWTAAIERVETASAGVWSRITLTGADARSPRQAIERAAASLQASLDIEHGPLMRAVLFDGIEEPRLLLAMHHLVVDAVSWRILIEDLQSACAQQMSGQQVVLPPKTTSVPTWAERLSAYAAEPELAPARAWWRAAVPGARLPVDYAVGAAANIVGAASTISVGLSAAETDALLRDVPKAYQTQINDVLLTAAVQAAAPWTRSSTLVVDVEGHGRESIDEALDLGRTVGWFTTIAPIALTLPSAVADAGAPLRAVKEQLRAVPGGGLAYMAIRFASADAAARAAAASMRAEIGFNYLGQLDDASGGERLFSPAFESVGPMASPRQRRRHLIEILGAVVNGRLTLDWSYCPHIHTRATVDALAQRCVAALRTLITHCTTPGIGGYTPSDFPLAALAESQLDEALSQVEFE